MSSKQGLLKKRYQVVLRTLIFLRNGSEVLLIKGAPTKRLWANLYNGIGGHVDKGEDILTAAKRELVEEPGIIPDSLYLCGLITIDIKPTRGIQLFVFGGSCSSEVIRTSSEGSPNAESPGWIAGTARNNSDNHCHGSGKNTHTH